MKAIGLVFTCGIIFGGTLAEIVNKLGGPIVRIELPLWADVLILLAALLVAIWATSRDALNEN